MKYISGHDNNNPRCLSSPLLLRYIGEGYSLAQESMEDEMRECYSSSSSSCSSPAMGQLAAVLAEEEEEVLRAQVCEVMGDKVKVRFKGQPPGPALPFSHSS